MSKPSRGKATPTKRRRPPSINDLNKIVATNQALTDGDEVVQILTEQGIDAKDPTVRKRLRTAQRNIRRLNKRLKKGWL
ncbi:hypothetical protein [Nocardioides albus]|uniref:Uncharacterized protein n=1 Tax=Nocardioides albus TaxID=1841 RepID=A0A7W5FA52_9ACTN|nr:hypothetical protein [Nocardioides albus]MBB3090791.1 hypothetical protein [Nocardioides albus]GGU37506.1 hypothetical protein GCM10007979_40660 [Nocardioides albus]